MKIKICGLSTKEAVDTAVESGVTHLGFILSPSKRQVAPEKILQITNDVPKTVKLLNSIWFSFTEMKI